MAFQRSRRWGAVLVLDNLGLFLVQRSPDDVRRSGLMGALMREFEYSQALCFATTNETTNLDCAMLDHFKVVLDIPSPNVERKREILYRILRPHEVAVLKQQETSWQHILALIPNGRPASQL